MMAALGAGVDVPALDWSVVVGAFAVALVVILFLAWPGKKK